MFFSCHYNHLMVKNVTFWGFFFIVIVCILCLQKKIITLRVQYVFQMMGQKYAFKLPIGHSRVNVC